MLRLVVWLYHTRCGPLLSHVLHVTCCCRLVIPHPVWSAIESHITCYMLQVVFWSCHTRCGPSLWYPLLIEIPLLSSPLLLSQLCVPFPPFLPPFFPSFSPPLQFSYCPCLHVTCYMLHVTVQLPSRAGSTLGCGQVRGGALVVVGSLAPLIFSHLAAIAAEFLQQSGVTAW